ncbi:hypothetical protein [Vibrio sp. PNB22_4_2]
MFKGCHFPSEAIRYYLAYKLRYREIEEIQLEHGVMVGHTTIHWWVTKLMGVSSVPTVMFNREHYVSGGHPVEGYQLILTDLMPQANED